MGRRRVMDEPMVMMPTRVPPRVVEALQAKAKASGVTVGELLDRLCRRAGLYE